ncbi:MAG: hypothetical protein H6709_20690 [Kofleriaceae bacterium]|nr:hypothetical protein [Kofleriaceae bacterium]
MRAVAVVCVLLFAGCNGGGGDECSVETCAGCCRDGVCERGALNHACGQGGAACDDCGDGICTAQVCDADPVIGRDWGLVTDDAPFAQGVFLADGDVLRHFSNGGAWTSRDGEEWTEIPAPPVNAICAARFEGTLWLFTATGLWSSTDGVSWVQRTAPGPYPSGGCYAWHGSLWAVSGFEVLASPDGVTWSRVGAISGATRGHVVVLGDTLFFVGWDNVAPVVATSADGMNWTSLTTRPAYGFAQELAVAVADGRMWLVTDDSTTAAVWSSTDGLAWTEVTSAPAFGARAAVALVSFDPTGSAPRLWLFGGVPPHDEDPQPEIWVSP